MLDDKANGFTILHISDTHFQCTDDFDADIKMTTLLEYLSGLAEKELAPAAVVFSGDVAFSGKTDEYEIAGKFFDQVLKAFRVEDRKRLFVVPGNHDVDWDLITPEHEKQIRAIRKDRFSEDSDRFFESKDLLRPFLEKFRGYQTFSTGYLGKRFDEDEHCSADLVEVDGFKIGIASFNSAWLVTKDEGDEGIIKRQLLGVTPLLRTLPLLEDADLKIALFHHPWHWLLDSTQGRIERLLQKETDLIVYGHQVKPDIKPGISLGGQEKPYCYIQGGPLYHTQDWPNRFQLIRFEIQGNERTVTIIPHMYYLVEKSWCPDMTLGKPYHKPNKLGKIRISPETVYPDLQALIDKLNCELLKEEKFSSPSGEEEILDFYCGSPLSWKIIAADGDIRRSLEKEVLNEATQNLNDFRIVCIVAEPGAGKSTLAWRAAYELFREGNLIFFVWDISNTSLWHKLPQLARYIGRHFYVLIDDIFHEHEFVKALKRLPKDGLPVTVLATARSNEFNVLGLDKRFIKRMDLKLGEEEKKALLDRLGKSYDALLEDVQRVFRETDLFLVLGMVLTKGKSFDRIIDSMIKSLVEEDKKYPDSSLTFSTAFKYVCFSYSYGVSVPEELLSNLYGDRRF